MVWEELSRIDPGALVPHREEVARQLRRYPHSFLLQSASLAVAELEQDYALQRWVGEQAVRCAPRNPSAWLARAAALRLFTFSR